MHACMNRYLNKGIEFGHVRVMAHRANLRSTEVGKKALEQNCHKNLQQNVIDYSNVGICTTNSVNQWPKQCSVNTSTLTHSHQYVYFTEIHVYTKGA